MVLDALPADGVEAMDGVRAPRETDGRALRQVHAPGRANREHLRAHRAGDDRIGAEIFHGDDARGKAGAVDQPHLLRPDAEERAAATLVEHYGAVGAAHDRAARRFGERDDVHGRRPDEPRREHARRPRVQGGGRRVLLDATGAQEDDLIRHRHGFGLIVRDVDHRHAELLLQRADLAPHLGAKLRVEVRERLVHEAHRLLGDDGAPERDALLLAAGELRRLAIEQRGQPEQLGDAREALPTLRGRHAADLQAEDDVFFHAQMREQRVRLKHHRDAATRWWQFRDVFAVDDDASRADGLEPGDEA